MVQIIFLKFAFLFPLEKSTVDIENHGAVRLIAINRPERRNAVDPPTAKLLYTAFKDFDSDQSAKVAIIYGKGLDIALRVFPLLTIMTLKD